MEQDVDISASVCDFFFFFFWKMAFLEIFFSGASDVLFRKVDVGFCAY